MAPVDRFTERFRTPILIGTAVAVIGGLPLLHWLRFDFDPVNLRSPKVESIATLKALSDDPLINTNAVEIVAPSLEAARAAAKKVSALQQVARVLTIPIVAGIAYELLRLGGTTNLPWLHRLLAGPGLAAQRLTTASPDDAQLEVAVAAMRELAIDTPTTDPSGARTSLHDSPRHCCFRGKGLDNVIILIRVNEIT